MADQWYYARNNQQHGPHSAAQMKEMAASGQLLPSDLVWKEGMDEWKPASTIKGLLPTGAISPPPLPSPSTSALATLNSTDLFQRLWANKLLFFGLCLLVSLLMTGFVLLLIATFGGGPVFAGLFLLLAAIDVGLLLTVAGFGLKALMRTERKYFLHGQKPPLGAGNKKWEPVSGDGPALWFFLDGGFLRSDGLAARFDYNLTTDTITLRVPGIQTEIPLQVLSITKHELVLVVDGQPFHYKQGRTFSGEKVQESREKQKEFLKNAALVTGTAVAAVGVATLGLLVLSGAAAVAAGGMGASQSGGTTGGLASSSGSRQSGSARLGSSGGTASVSSPPELQRVPQALQGAVARGVTGSSAIFSHKCESCGWVDGSTFTVSLGGSGIQSGAFVCPQCKRQQPYRIQR